MTFSPLHLQFQSRVQLASFCLFLYRIFASNYCYLLWKTQRMWSVGSVWDQARSWHGVGMWLPNQQILSQISAWRGIISVILLYCFMWMIPKVHIIFPFSQRQLYSTWSLVSSICNVCHICKLSYNATTSSYCVFVFAVSSSLFFERKWKKIYCKERSLKDIDLQTQNNAPTILYRCTFVHLLDFETFHQELLHRHCASFR